MVVKLLGLPGSRAEIRLASTNRGFDAASLDGQDLRRVMEVKAHNVVLDGLTITNGYITSGDAAGLLINDGVANASDLTVLNCRVVDNQNYDSDNPGGRARFNSAGDILVSNCEFPAE